jgi:hypothetical protein
MASTTAVSTSAFLDTIGVNTHLEYTDGAYDDSPSAVQQVLADLQYLGIDQVRDGVPELNGSTSTEDYEAALQTLTAAGIKFDFVSDPSQSLTTTISALNAVEAMHPGDIIAVEGPNEINNYPITYDGCRTEIPLPRRFRKRFIRR